MTPYLKIAINNSQHYSSKFHLISMRMKIFSFFNLKINRCIAASIYKFGLSVCLFVCLFVCLYPINVKTAEPIRPKFFVGHHMIPGKVYGWSNFQKFASIKIRFLKILKIHEFFFENPRNFFVCYLFTRRSPVYFIFTNEIKYRREAPWISSKDKILKCQISF